MRLPQNSGIMVWLVWFGLAIILWGAVLGLVLWAPSFAHGLAPEQMPIAEFVTAYVVICLAFFLILPPLVRASGSLNAKYLMLFVIVVGIFARLGFIGGPTTMEDDYNRYLWDGAITASGENPYAHSPEEIRTQLRKEGNLYDTLIKHSDGVFERINFPQFSTVYPPAAQLVFAITYWISPFNLDALRIVLLCFELGSLALIIMLLKHFDLPLQWATLYWWNPLVIKEIANSAHMEPVLMLSVLAAGYFVLKKRFHFSSVMLAIAAGIKVWPALLVVVIWRQLLPDFKQLILNSLLFGILLGLMVSPIILTGLNQESGFVAFGGQWQASSIIFLVSEWLAFHLTPYWVDDYLDIPIVSRVLLGISLLAFIAVICIRRASDANELLWRIFLIIAGIYLLSPTHAPWYFLWLAPLLCIYPVRGLWLAGVLIPLHYGYFHFAARDMHDIYHDWIVWFIWTPVWIFLASEFVKNKVAGEARTLAR